MPGRPGDKSAQFIRVAARIREKVMSREWPLGHRLPAEYELAEAYGVSRGTIVRALEQLRDEGLIMTTHGQGSAVAVEPDVTVVRVGPGDAVMTRLPEDSERDALNIPPGVPLLAVTRPGAAEPELYNGAVTVIRGA
jgi:DNA-binding transcriptional MocR family regulator